MFSSGAICCSVEVVVVSPISIPIALPSAWHLMTACFSGGSGGGGRIFDILIKDVFLSPDIDKRDHTTIVGTDDKDYIVGSEEDDLICAEDGNDVIFSDAGVDAIFAQGGRSSSENVILHKFFWHNIFLQSSAS